jgi:U4/U6.U5 tri-snRNP-associated protein 2
LPGYVGLNNVKANDYLNVVIHALLHIPPLRDYLLLSNLSRNSTEAEKGSGPIGKQSSTELLRRFAGLAKKLWNPRLFKAQVSPHEFLQEITHVSGGKFKLTEQGDPVDFLGWLLNRLHRDMGGTKKRNSC